MPQPKKRTSYIPTSPDDPNAQEMGIWQPERLTLREGLRRLPLLFKIIYIVLILSTAVYDCWAYPQLPELISLSTWFGYSSMVVHKLALLGVVFLLLIYLIYRDIINRSLSRRKLFIPLIFFLGNYYVISEILSLL